MVNWHTIMLVTAVILQVNTAAGNPDAKRLFEKLTTGYNKLIRPTANNSRVVTIKVKLKLSQLIDVHEKNQIMTTNVWLKQEWVDENFVWSPADYGGLRMLHLPADHLWLPDIVLYNNADGNYQATIMTKALVLFNGSVIWEPPAIYKSMCQIDVRWFPFDEQRCEMKFGSWTYDGNEVDLAHGDWQRAFAAVDAFGQNVTMVEQGIDLSDFYPSVEWDIMRIPSTRHEITFACCPAPYIDITFELSLRRKTLFYTVNLIIPSTGISFLTVLVFYLPSDSGEKVVLCISILISLTFFFLILIEIIPSTSLVIPMIGLYLLFTMVMVTCSIAVTVVTLNIHYRSPNTHSLPRWIRSIMRGWLPWILAVRRPKDTKVDEVAQTSLKHSASRGRFSVMDDARAPLRPSLTAVDGACYIADHLRQQNLDDQIRQDWRYIAQILDRLFLCIFSLVCLVATCVIILRAPVIHDTRRPVTESLDFQFHGRR